MDVDGRTRRALLLGRIRDGLFKSTDAGASWTPAATRIRNATAVAVNPKRPSEVYAATTDGTIFRSADGGTTWQHQP
jgi:photosystem II stability/assembly factor-like uncharacterized protein